jgi:hypothetical protein
LTSSNLWNWLPLATNETGPNGFATFFDPLLPQRFYRAVVP